MLVPRRDQLTCGDCARIDTPDCHWYNRKIPKIVPIDDEAFNCPNFYPKVKDFNNLTSKLTYFDNNGKFLPKILGDELLASYYFVTMSDNRDLYVYKEGVYVPNGDNIIREQIREKLEKRATTHYVKEGLDHIKDLTTTSRYSFNNDVNLLCLENGIYNLKTGKLQPHTPAIKFLQKHPLVFDPDAKCPNIDKFLEEVLPRPEDREAILQLFGYCLYRSHKIQRAFMLVGGGSNGKSTLLNLFKMFLGRDNITSTSLQDLETNRFAIARLLGKNANIYPDLPTRSLQSTSRFKGATGEDLLTGEFKFGRDFNFENYAKFIFSANKVPISSDDSDAFYRRWIIITFTETFQGSNRDPNLLSKLITEAELSGLFNKAIQTLKHLLEKGEFTNAKNTEETREDYIRKSDCIEAFVMDCVETDPDSTITKNELYSIFQGYCKERGYIPPAYTKFCSILPKKIPYIKSERPDSKAPRQWRGIKVVPSVPGVPRISESYNHTGTSENKIGKYMEDMTHLALNSLDQPPTEDPT